MLAVKDAYAAYGEGAQTMVVAAAAHQKIVAFGGGLRRRSGAPAELVGPFFGLGSGAVVHGHLVAAFFHQMSCHRETHDAETEKSDFSHVCYLVLPWGFLGGFGRTLNWPDGVL